MGRGRGTSSNTTASALPVHLAIPLLLCMSHLVSRSFWGDFSLWGSSWLENFLPTYSDGSKTVTSAATSTRWDPYLPVTANEMRDAQLNQSAPLLGPRTGIGTTILSRLAVRSEME